MKNLFVLLVGAVLGITLMVGSCNFGGGGGDSVESGQPTAKWFVEKGPPSSVQGANGDLYLDTDAAVLYVKTSGQWQAAASLRGPAGSGWLFGAGAPASTLGTDGDLYLDTATSMAYRKQGGAWSTLVALKGATGPQGPTGTSGTQWYSGSANPTPTVPSGAIAGDYYFHTSTAMIYRKDAGGNWSSVLVMASSTASFVYTPYMTPGGEYSSVYFNAVTYGNGTYIAVGDQGTIIRSTDGVYWTIVESTPYTSKIRKGLEPSPSPSSTIDDYLQDVAFGNGIFVAVGEFGVYTSLDNGLSWAFQNVGPSSFTSVAFLNGKFYLSSFSETPNIYYSSNGTSWSESVVGRPYLSVVAYGNGKYLAFTQDDGLDGVCTSTDGVSWTYTSISAITGLDSSCAIFNVVFGNGLFVAVGTDYNITQGRIWISSDTINWSTVDLPVTATDFRDIAFGNGFAAIGYDYNNNSNYLLSSSNGISWNVQSFPPLNSLYNPGSYALFAGISSSMPGGFAIAVSASGNGVNGE